jgi:hypothetical protein
LRAIVIERDAARRPEPVVADDDVARLEVAMHDARCVRRREPSPGGREHATISCHDPRARSPPTHATSAPMSYANATYELRKPVIRWRTRAVGRVCCRRDRGVWPHRL